MAIVKLYDINEFELGTWAMSNCPSFQGWLIYENSDSFSYEVENENIWMVRYEFEFSDDHDAMLFRLRWQGQ